MFSVHLNKLIYGHAITKGLSQRLVIHEFDHVKVCWSDPSLGLEP